MPSILISLPSPTYLQGEFDAVVDVLHQEAVGEDVEQLHGVVWQLRRPRQHLAPLQRTLRFLTRWGQWWNRGQWWNQVQCGLLL